MDRRAALAGGHYDYGLFSGPGGAAQSWVCRDGVLEVFADRHGAVSAPAIARVSVPDCQLKSKSQTGALVWNDGSAVSALDLATLERFELKLPPVSGSPTEDAEAVLDGYAVSAIAYHEPTCGPTRT